VPVGARGLTPVKIVYSERYNIDIGAHVFETSKYGLVSAAITPGLCAPADRVEPVAASWEDLALVHDGDYLRKARTGTLTRSDLALLELPWSEAMVEGFRLMAGGSVMAARLACADLPRARAGNHAAFAANLGGGLHHAFPAHGEGFCLFNDVALAIRVLQRDGTIERAAVVDCDVHQGNGTAFIFDGDRSVFTFSIHQEHNYPAVKPRSSLDIGLADGAGDREYLDALEGALPSVLASRPDLICYVAGADPYAGDQLGGLGLTREGLRQRDAMVLRAACAAALPVVIVLAGGYARRVQDTAAIHVATIEEAASLAVPGGAA
jgi:acetoin utilization deacetylase AcuC-like enzyme